MADGTDPHRATVSVFPHIGTPPIGQSRFALLTEAEEAIGPEGSLGDDVAAGPDPGIGNLQPITDRCLPLPGDVAAGPDPATATASRADVGRRRLRGRRHRIRRSGAGSRSQASPSAVPTTDQGYPSSAAPAPFPSPDYPGTVGRIRVRQSVLYSDRPRHSRPRGLERAEASVVGSSQLHSPVMDLPTFEALSLSDPSLSTPETTEMTNVDYASRSGQGEHTCELNSSEFDMEVIEEALSSSEHPLLTPQTETDEESTDEDCAWVPPIRETKFFFNRPKGISRSMVLSSPPLSTMPNVKEQRPKLYSDVDPKEVQRLVKEYLDARPCINLDVASDSFLTGEDLARAIAEEDSVAAAHPQHSMVPTESRGTAWMNEEVMLCFKKFIDKNRYLAKLEDYHLDELQHQCFNVESYDKVYHHYNFTVRMKMPESDWKVKLYFAEVKEVFRQKFYLCYPLDSNENGQCYACKNQGVKDLRHPVIDLYETGSSSDASCNLWYTDIESDEE